MAREHARLLVRVNADRDFAELTPTEQWLFQRLTARQELNYAGVLPYDAKRWARMSRHITVEEIEKAAWRLHEGRYLVIDEETDEVLVRTLIRNDEVAKQPNVLRAALRAAQFVESDTLRIVLAAELRRVRPVAKEWQRPAIDEVVSELDPDGSPAPSVNPSPNPSVNPPRDTVENPSANPVAAGSGEPFREPQGVVEVEGEGESGHPERSLGGSRTRAGAREAAVPAVPDSPAPPVSATNGHAHGTQPCGRRHDPARACVGCRDARRAAEQADDDAEAAARAERAAEAERRRACQACDANGWLEHPESGQPVVRCDHETEPRQQLADALGLTP